MPKKVVKKWYGTWPAKCNVCRCDLTKCKYFVDGKTRMGPWGLLCPECHASHGSGLGIGLGQRYNSKTLIKEGG